MKYMLDTNMIIYARNGQKDQLNSLFGSYGEDDLCISAITLAELEFGVCNSQAEEKNRELLYLFLSGFTVIPFDRSAAREYGEIRADLKKKGTPIGANDLFIAAHARSLDLTLVTNNTREFDRVEGLKVENWLN